MKRILAFIAGLFLALAAHAADLTPAQRATLKSAANAEPSIQTCITTADDACVADWFNAPSSKIVWRTQVLKHEVTSLPGPTGTQFDWAGTGGYIARSTGERDAFNTIFNSTGSVNPSYSNVQAAMADIFSGTGAGAVNNRAHFLAVSKRTATHAEAAIATGTGTTQSPATLTWEGAISAGEAGSILRN